MTETNPTFINVAGHSDAMTVIAKSDYCEGVLDLWRDVLGGVASAIQRMGAHPARAVVLVPYAQLMPWAQHYWGLLHPDGFAPRFETTRNWARQLDAFLPQGNDLAGDTGRDILTARALLDRAGLTAQREMLAAPLQEAAAQLATVVAAVQPHERDAWTRHARRQLPVPEEPFALRYEALVARIALEWAAASRYATDVLFEPDVRDAVDVLIVLQGFQTDLLAATLLVHWGDRGLLLPLAKEPDSVYGNSRIALHSACDAEDEAQRAAACVLAHISTGRVPVALASNDRALTRRISAHLAHRGVAVRDENGWTLSTMRCAAQLMAALKAAAWDASSDDVLDWLKQVPLIDQGVLAALERDLRRAALPSWSGVTSRDWGGTPLLAALVSQVAAWLEGLRSNRALVHWLEALRALLRATGLWDLLERDAAGARVLSALRLQDGQDVEFDGWDMAVRRMSLPEFTRWVNEVLEAARFIPVADAGVPVTVLPLAQLLARPFAALVLPGCDERRLVPAPEPQGEWTRAQRLALSLPTRESQEAAQRAAWQSALSTPAVDILWRTGDEGGEPVLASPLVQALHLDGIARAGADFRSQREVVAACTQRPGPRGDALALQRLSSTAYSDLRHCPYRFFALRLLSLYEQDELSAEVDKRDFGNWLHEVLQLFHEQMRDADPGAPPDRATCLDQAARVVTERHGLAGEAEGDFLPFAAGWPQLRDGYLRWLAQHEQAGGAFRSAEVKASQRLGNLRLVGTIDRIDGVSTTGEPEVLVIDYKTESDDATRKRITAGAEDTQLAFYAALLSHDTLRAAYVNVGERGQTKMHEHKDIAHLRDLLVEGIEHDFAQIAEGAPMRALGEGAVCEYCAARGLCRKDFWK